MEEEENSELEDLIEEIILDLPEIEEIENIEDEITRNNTEI